MPSAASSPAVLLKRLDRGVPSLSDIHPVCLHAVLGVWPVEEGHFEFALGDLGHDLGCEVLGDGDRFVGMLVGIEEPSQRRLDEGADQFGILLSRSLCTMMPLLTAVTPQSA